jgi:hypothetical protein
MTITNARLDLRDVNDADVYLNDELVSRASNSFH